MSDQVNLARNKQSPCLDFDSDLNQGRRTRIMGVLNVTPDSFSDGGEFANHDIALSHAEKMVEQGADIIDIGGESSRPFSDPVSLEDEISRVLPVIEKLAQKITVPISIDTTKSDVAKRAIDAGACIINDISALRLDPKMAEIAAEAGVPVIIMHMKGAPKIMQENPQYDDLIGEIKTFLANAVDTAVKNGICRSKIIIDPGIGFGKTFEHNFMILNNLKAFKSIKAPILVGPSRKAFIRDKLKDIAGKDAAPPGPCSQIVETGTQAAVAAAVLNGADIVRCHDVAETRVTLKIIDAIRKSC
ncbi:MAG: dihydropteroate synthase [Deltaproteobacteria bacterium]|nr:dihydropteroate synthase [Deltaproteobacteria bacterium]